MSTADDIARRACRLAVKDLGSTAAICDLYDQACSHAYDIVNDESESVDPDVDNEALYEAIEGELHNVLK